MSDKKCKRKGHKWRKVRNASLGTFLECTRPNCDKEKHND